MTSLNDQNISEIVDQIRSWPPDARLSLARSILGTLEADLSTPRPKRSLRNLVGLLKTDSPPPTDEECEQILEEELMRKYGP